MDFFRRNTNQTHQAPFSFEYLWTVAQGLNASDPRNPYIFHPQDDQSRLTLTYEACIHYVGIESTRYTRQDVYDRVVLWRVPLIALIATTTLPALGVATKLFTILHLIADPIDALWSLFFKLNHAKRHAAWAKEVDNRKSIFTFKERPVAGAGGVRGMRRAQTQMQGIGMEDKQAKQQRLLDIGDPKTKGYLRDVFASIINAYEEWHLGSEAKSAIEFGL
jgi:hypothetical protein